MATIRRYWERLVASMDRYLVSNPEPVLLLGNGAALPHRKGHRHAALVCAAGLLISISARAAPSGSTAVWNKCMASAQETSEAAKVEQESGVAGLNEWLLERCGARPTEKSPTKRAHLSKGDCDKVFELARDGSCDRDEYSAYQTMLFDQLNAEVFQEAKFKAMCERMTKQSVGRKAFGAAVCGE
jgi:hypothetical protein